VIRPHWSPDVMDELERNLAERITAEKAHKRRATIQIFASLERISLTRFAAEV